MSKTDVLLNRDELEGPLRRVVREELARSLRSPAGSILEDKSQEGPDDATEDDLLLADALDVLRKHKNNPEAWMDWRDFEAELDRAEAAGEQWKTWPPSATMIRHVGRLAESP